MAAEMGQLAKGGLARLGGSLAWIIDSHRAAQRSEDPSLNLRKLRRAGIFLAHASRALGLQKAQSKDPGPIGP